MATVLNQNQDEDENSQNQGVVSSGESSQFAGGPAAQAAAPSARQPGSSGRFTNLSKYIQANNPSDLTNKVSGKVGEITGKAQGDLEKSKGQFQSDAEKTGQAVQQAQQGIQQGIQNISGSGDYNVSDEQFQQGLGQLQAAKNLQYTGPQGLSNEQNLAGQAQQLGSLGDATKTGGGRFALLQKFFNRPTYSTGQTNLDNLLLGSNNKALGDVRRTARSFGTELGKAQEQAAGQISGLQGNVANTRQTALTEAEKLAQGSLGDLGTELQSYYEREKARRDSNTGIDASGFQLGSGPTPYGFTGNATSTGKNVSVTLPGNMTGSENIDFSRTLSPAELRQLGIEQYTNDPLLSQYEQGGAGKEALLGRSNTVQTDQLNKLRQLLGQGSIQSGEQLQQGNFQRNAGKATEVQNAYNTNLSENLGQLLYGQALKPAVDAQGNRIQVVDNANRVNYRPPSSNGSAASTLEGLQKAAAYTRQDELQDAVTRKDTAASKAIQDRIRQEVLAKFKAQYGI